MNPLLMGGFRFDCRLLISHTLRKPITTLASVPQCSGTVIKPKYRLLGSAPRTASSAKAAMYLHLLLTDTPCWARREVLMHQLSCVFNLQFAVGARALVSHWEFRGLIGSHRACFKRVPALTSSSVPRRRPSTRPIPPLPTTAPADCTTGPRQQEALPCTSDGISF